MAHVIVLSAMGFVGQFAPVDAQNTKERSKTEKPAVSLNASDLAPALTVTKWLQGDAVSEFAAPDLTAGA
jgi:hypothetical protein